MTHFRARGAVIALLIGLNISLLASCAVTDAGYGYSTDVRIGVDYYDPWFGDYSDFGGWGPGYRVGPPRRIMPRPDFDRGRPPHAGSYRPAPGAHPIPSIPSRPHARDPRTRK
jgi:hypothetical protein